jgi:hypothetical protein
MKKIEATIDPVMLHSIKLREVSKREEARCSGSGGVS